MLGLSFTRRELQPNQSKHNCLNPQTYFETLAHDNQFKHVHYKSKHQIILALQKDDCHPALADFKNDQSSIRNNDKGENIFFEPLFSFSFEAFEPIQNQNKKNNPKDDQKNIATLCCFE